MGEGELTFRGLRNLGGSIPAIWFLRAFWAFSVEWCPLKKCVWLLLSILIRLPGSLSSETLVLCGSGEHGTKLQTLFCMAQEE